MGENRAMILVDNKRMIMKTETVQSKYDGIRIVGYSDGSLLGEQV